MRRLEDFLGKTVRPAVSWLSKLLKIKEYLNLNDLVINMDKMVLSECMIKQKWGRTAGSPTELEVENAAGQLETVRDSQYCRVLGATIQNNLTWIGHLEHAKKAILPEVRRNLGLLRSLRRKLPRSCRDTMARGMVTSKLTYLISIWGGYREPQEKSPDTVKQHC